MSGSLNNVDTVAQGYARIDPACKPSLRVVLTSNQQGIPMMFGAQDDTGKGQDFWEDNVGITPLVLKSAALKHFSFGVELSSARAAG